MIIKKYIGIYIKYLMKTAFSISMIGFVPLMIIYLIFLSNGTIGIEGLWLPLMFPVGACVVVLFCLLYLYGFQNMIREQEKTFEIRFNDENNIKLALNIYTSDHWLIFAGKYAFSRRYIKTITSFRTQRRVRPGYSYYIVVHTIDGDKYTIFVPASRLPDKIKAWYQQKQTDTAALSKQSNLH
ncbi:MAG: hypothetical protein IJW55_05660 [Clostridia bacterium]|nr:hypothetical protein [Clostridia bacterium]